MDAEEIGTTIQGNESAPPSTVIEVPTVEIDGLPSLTVPVYCDAQRMFHVGGPWEPKIRAYLLERGWIDGERRQEVLTPAPDLQQPAEPGGDGQ